MKKGHHLFLGIVLFGLFIMTGCQTREKEAGKTIKTIDPKIVEKLEGNWYQEEQGFTPYTIHVKAGEIELSTPTKTDRLTVEETKDGKVFTNPKDALVCIFSFEEDGMIISPSYQQVKGEKGMTGGDLAPIVLRREKAITLEGILGQWESTEADYPGYVLLKATSKPDRMELWLSQDAEMSNPDIRLMKLEERNEEALKFIDQENPLQYRFSYISNGQLLLISGTTVEDQAGMARPYLLKKVRHQ